MLSVSDLSGSRGERTLFSGLNFDLAPGQWLQVSGANGVGKTSLLRMLVGLSAPDSGTICWKNQPIGDQSDDYRAALLYLGHLCGLKDELTPLENLQLAQALDGYPVDEGTALAALARMGLRGREHLPVRVLSAGQKRRTVQARLLLRPASLWVLDEPFSALDGAGVQLLCGLIEGHLQAGGLAVLTSHQSIPMQGGRELAL